MFQTGTSLALSCIFLPLSVWSNVWITYASSIIFSFSTPDDLLDSTCMSCRHLCSNHGQWTHFWTLVIISDLDFIVIVTFTSIQLLNYYLQYNHQSYLALINADPVPPRQLYFTPVRDLTFSLGTLENETSCCHKESFKKQVRLLISMWGDRDVN
jgi:hypothetical protein